MWAPRTRTLIRLRGAAKARSTLLEGKVGSMNHANGTASCTLPKCIIVVGARQRRGFRFWLGFSSGWLHRNASLLLHKLRHRRRGAVRQRRGSFRRAQSKLGRGSLSLRRAQQSKLRRCSRRHLLFGSWAGSFGLATGSNPATSIIFDRSCRIDCGYIRFIQHVANVAATCC